MIFTSLSITPVMGCGFAVIACVLVGRWPCAARRAAIPLAATIAFGGQAAG
ncbi:hypothetical protein U713_07335 [Rhodobacter capsulatus YW2]|nr:hypothetical protein U713_07335 [Rhodobacter capsulatus YW2]